MNAETKNQLAAVASTQTAVDAMAVVTLSPEKYAAEVYQPFKAKLVSAIDSVRAIDYDIKTTAGMAVAIRARALFRDLRIDADKERKARKEPITKIGKLLESGYDAVEESITPLELMFDGDIKDEEARKEAEKVAKIAAERARIESIKADIQKIRDNATACIGKTSAEIRAVLESVASITLEKDKYQDLIDEASKAVCDTALRLEELLGKAEAAELAEANRIATVEADRIRMEAERQEIQRQQAALAAAKAAQDAEAAAARLAIQQEQARLADAAEEAERRATAEREQQARVAAESKRQMEAQQAQINADRAKLETEKEAARVAALPVEVVAEVAGEVEPEPEANGELFFLDISADDTPSAETLVMIVANELGTDRATALAWLLEADFESLEVA